MRHFPRFPVLFVLLAFAGVLRAQGAGSQTKGISILDISLPVVWLGMMGFVLWRNWAELSSDDGAASSSEDDETWLNRALPIVRVRRKVFWFPFMRREDAIVLYRDEIVQLHKRKRRDLAPAAYHLEGAKELAKAPGSRLKRVIPLAVVKRIVLKKPLLAGFFYGLIRMKVYTAKGAIRLYVRASELPNLLRAFEALLPGRVMLPAGVEHKWYRRKKEIKDLSRRRPYRSRTLSLGIRLASIGLLVGGATFLISTSRWGYAVLLYVLLAALLQIANGLREKDPAKQLGSDRLRPILYLRSFLDDRKTSLHPETWFSSVVGLDPPFYSLDQYRDAKFYRLARAIIQSVSNHHPIRMLKLWAGRPLDDSEEQVSSFFARFGIFVAIGKPGERFATTGVSRMYVGNDEWQEVVKTLLRESQVIMLQPSRTEGVWWEVEQTIGSVEPPRVLMCLVNYRGRQNDYESFRLRLENFLPAGVQVPRDIGNRRGIFFFYFDDNWQPHALKLLYYSRLVWPFRLRAVNAERTLEPFLKACGLVDANGKMPPSAERSLGAVGS
jgi:hypothetical protein